VNLPNALSMSRLLLLPFILLFLVKGYPSLLNFRIISAGIFAGAAATDFLDGYLARKQQLTSDLGVFLDLTSDKALVAGVLITMTALGLVDAWITVVIVLREFFITGLRSFAAARGMVIPAGPGGKLKTLVTLVALIGLVIAVDPIRPAATVLLWVAVLLTVASGVQYSVNAFPVLASQGEARSEGA
jgi:CDP-diacylglycerol--glycerol-3-phosphate 3-phosphatidyltransferase